MSSWKPYKTFSRNPGKGKGRDLLREIVANIHYEDPAWIESFIYEAVDRLYDLWEEDRHGV